MNRNVHVVNVKYLNDEGERLFNQVYCDAYHFTMKVNP